MNQACIDAKCPEDCEYTHEEFSDLKHFRLGQGHYDASNPQWRCSPHCPETLADQPEEHLRRDWDGKIIAYRPTPTRCESDHHAGTEDESPRLTWCPLTSAFLCDPCYGRVRGAEAV